MGLCYDWVETCVFVTLWANKIYISITLLFPQIIGFSTENNNKGSNNFKVHKKKF